MLRWAWQIGLLWRRGRWKVPYAAAKWKLDPFEAEAGYSFCPMEKRCRSSTLYKEGTEQHRATAFPPFALEAFPEYPRFYVCQSMQKAPYGAGGGMKRRLRFGLMFQVGNSTWRWRCTPFNRKPHLPLKIDCHRIIERSDLEGWFWSKETIR